MKVEWDYTALADAYLKRPEYAQEAIDKMVALAALPEKAILCDVGAGAAHLTLMLAKKRFEIYAVEPNNAMRANGVKRTKNFPNVQWFQGVGENTGMESSKFDLVTFGSSFNVCDRLKALQETKRILKEHGWFACMWNHRNLDDPLQAEIEQIIKENVQNYQYGTRREDQTEIINQSGLFHGVARISGSIVHTLSAQDFIEGWKSHGTLQRQSKELFDVIIQKIAQLVHEKGQETLNIPYTTNIWMAQVK